jgi:hypothetical protein
VTHFEWTTAILTGIGVLFLPAIAILIRGAIKWTRTEDKLAELVRDVHELVDSKDKVHTEMYAQMREDRAATDRRLRYLEERLMH